MVDELVFHPNAAKLGWPNQVWPNAVATELSTSYSENDKILSRRSDSKSQKMMITSNYIIKNGIRSRRS